MGAALALVHTFEGHEVRVIKHDDEPWFVAADVCRVLEIGNPSDVIAALDEDEKGLDSIETLGGTQTQRVISEAGVYSVIFRSRKPEAKAFKRWVTHDVLPSIRKTGAYVAPSKVDPALLRENRLAAKEERLGREQKLRVFRELKEIPSLTPEERRVICIKEAEIVGEPMPALLPKNEQADWISPTDIATIASSTPHAVGRTISALKLKGEDGKGIEGTSRPIHNVAPGTNRSITTYVYSPTAVEQILASLKPPS